MKTCIRCTPLLLLLLLLSACAAAPKFDLSAGEIAAGEGLTTLHMPASDLPAPWTAEEEPGKWEAALAYAGIAFDASARADEEGTLKQVTLSADDDGSWAQADVDALVQALNADYGIELVKTYDKGDFLTYAFRRNRHSVQVDLRAGRSLSFRIYYLPEMPGYEWV